MGSEIGHKNICSLGVILIWLR